MKPTVSGDFTSISAFSIYKRKQDKETGSKKSRKPRKKKLEAYSNLQDSLCLVKLKKPPCLGPNDSTLTTPQKPKTTENDISNKKKVATFKRIKQHEDSSSSDESMPTLNTPHKPKLPENKTENGISKKKKLSKFKTIKQPEVVNEDSSTSDESIPTLIPIEPEPLPSIEKKEAQPAPKNPVSETNQLLKWLIDPVTPPDFFKTYWEKKPLHIERTNRDYHKHILSSKDLDQILRNHNLHFTRNVDVVTYENGVKEVFNQEGKATASVVWDYYTNGCSIRILNPHTYHNKVHLLLVTLQEYFGSMVGANVYLTPPGSQGFAPHYDDIEAFVIQLEGRKHWKLYKPQNSDVLARFSSPNLKREDIGEPYMELTLNAGELLYFPRGVIHEGCTDEDSHSLHITVSVYQQNSYTDLLENLLPNALAKASENEVAFRKGLPIDYLKNFGLSSTAIRLRPSVESYVKRLLQSLVNYIDIDSAVDLLGKRLMRDSLPPVYSKYELERTSKGGGPSLDRGQVKKRGVIESKSKIRLLRYYCIRLVQEKNSPLKLFYCTENANVYHGEEEQWLELDEGFVPAIRKLQRAYPSFIEVCKLPMNDEMLKIQLVSDLWEHGLVVVE